MDRSRPPERQLRQPPVLHGCDGYRLAVQGRDIGDDDADGAAMWAGSVSIARALVLELHQVLCLVILGPFRSSYYIHIYMLILEYVRSYSRRNHQDTWYTYIRTHVWTCTYGPGW